MQMATDSRGIPTKAEQSGPAAPVPSASRSNRAAQRGAAIRGGEAGWAAGEQSCSGEDCFCLLMRLNWRSPSDGFCSWMERYLTVQQSTRDAILRPIVGQVPRRHMKSPTTDHPAAHHPNELKNKPPISCDVAVTLLSFSLLVYG